MNKDVAQRFRQQVREELEAHTRLMGGDCLCGAQAEDGWQYREHLADEIAKLLT